MVPILLSVGGITIYTFGIFLVLAFFWGCFFLWKNIRLTSYKEEEVFDGLFFALFLGAILGRLAHVLLNWNQFGFDIVKILLVNGYPGFSLLGFLGGFVLGYGIFATGRKMRFLDLFDYVIPAFLLALAIGKVGSFFAGIEYGSLTDLPISVVYATLDGTRHLTPLYEGLALGLGSFFSFRLLFLVRRDLLDHGFVFFFAIWFMSLVFFGTSFIQGEQTIIAGYSVEMAVSAFLLLTFSLYFVYYFRAAILRPFQKKLSSSRHDKPSEQRVHSKSKKGS